MSVDSLHRRFYAGEKYDGTKQFYDWIRQSSSPASRMLNLGAGPATLSPVRTFKGEVAEIVGADVDASVMENNELDRAVMIEGGRLPLEDNSFDIAYSDYVLEHVEHPEMFLAELCRVLKPGASYFFRTPNIYHYVAMISAATPQWFHHKIANRARSNSEGSQEPWPTFYRMNSRGALTRASRNAGFTSVDLRMVEMEPSYLRFNSAAFLIGTAYERAVNSSEIFAGARSNIFGRLMK